ncbi:type IV secretion system protein [Solirhodobacter olei]|uniref:type IV secretion system protein n=1 Tax=Solirhodobacter olei TaxID=2493082 RepID=UPI000FD73270|nr:type IV secretion system protein [Solirhodobacter olei]
MRGRRSSLPVLALGLAAAILLSAAPAEAAGSLTTPGTFMNIPTLYQEAVAGVGANLASYARNLMALLALIELVWTIGRIVVTGGDLGEMLYAVISRMLIIGAFVWLTDALPQYGGMDTFVTDFASRLFSVSTGDTTGPIDPGSVLHIAVSSGLEFYKAATLGNTLAAIMIILVNTVIGAIVAAFMVLAYVEIHILFAGGIIALGFAPWGETRVLARNFLFAAIGKALKLFGVLLVGTATMTVLQKVIGGSDCVTCLAGPIMMKALLTTAVLVVGAIIIILVPPALEHIVMSGPGSRSGMSSVGAFAGGLAGGAIGVAATRTAGGVARTAAAGFGAMTSAPSKAQSNIAALAANAKANAGKGEGS